MTISVQILADSRHPLTHARLTTMLLRYPRFIHAEFMTHRMFARNSSSSRAIPSRIMRQQIREDPALPLSWGARKAGMQQGADLGRGRAFIARMLWLALMHVALLVSAALDRLGVHKAIVNRVVEPWSHITVVVSGIDAAYANFYALRRHEAAEPTMRALAEAMAEKHALGAPYVLAIGEWHLPFAVTRTAADIPTSVARCARTSYGRQGTWSMLVEDKALHDRLLGSRPMHASPAEHQAQATRAKNRGGCFGRSGWTMYRMTLAGEATTNLGEVLR